MAFVTKVLILIVFNTICSATTDPTDYVKKTGTDTVLKVAPLRTLTSSGFTKDDSFTPTKMAPFRSISAWPNQNTDGNIKPVQMEMAPLLTLTSSGSIKDDSFTPLEMVPLGLLKALPDKIAKNPSKPLKVLSLKEVMAAHSDVDGCTFDTCNKKCTTLQWTGGVCTSGSCACYEAEIENDRYRLRKLEILN
ncbi:hypothetical protein NQ317_016388 [Molorchus minor]|uniref:Uncharacterized protein n=1 Tax=Molorchus minor TaxID=1323400 RepID=A0ABQ9JK33_9CUCU|nr:hypothetical protein NQ317_016388 [Molorchus minor]